MKTTLSNSRAEDGDVHASGGDVSVVIASDSPVVRKRLQVLLAEEPQVNVVGEGGCALEAWLLFQQRHPRAMVFDLQMADGNGLELARRIKQSAPRCVIIILTNVRGAPSHQECRCLGVDYFFHKATEFDRVAGVLHGLATTAAA